MLFLFLLSLTATTTNAQGGCADAVGTCVQLANLGYCATNALVQQKCPFSCGTCTPGGGTANTPAPTPAPTKNIGGSISTGGDVAVIDPRTGCYNTNKDCSDEVLECTNEFNNNNTTLTFDNLKVCIYEKVALGQATRCCNDYVTVGQQLDPDYESIKARIAGRTVAPTPAPVVGSTTPSPIGPSDKCRKQRISSDCLNWGSCEWDYWTRTCAPAQFNTAECVGDNRDCKHELSKCIDSERQAGRTPQIRNLEPCVLMNPQSDCCRFFTNQKLALQGPKRPHRPDRFDKDNCELYHRNTACKNQNHCQWDKQRKKCMPMSGISAPGLWYVPEMSCGYKSFKLHFTYKITVTKRNVKTSCECSVFCKDYRNWVWRQSSSKCGCTNQAVTKVSRNKKGWYGSSTKHAPKRDISGR